MLDSRKSKGSNESQAVTIIGVVTTVNGELRSICPLSI